MPASWKEAIILPLPKSGDRTDPLNYRPIALLQTTYKIMAKVMAARVQNVLGPLIHEGQQGFVRGRDIHSSIHVMREAMTYLTKQQSKAPPAEASCVVLLDFRKAYDTLNRGFLFDV